MAEPLVRACRVSRIYLQGGTPAPVLVSATCEVATGERIAVTGPSGSGKSTLLHILGGLEAPSTGEIAWPDLGPREQLRPGKIALAFQAPSLEPTLDVVENVELPLLLTEDEPVPRERAYAALELLGLGGLAARLPEELSRGQAQRIGLARALACGPRLLLADEPTGQLDRAAGARLMDILLDYVARHEIALVVATHDTAVAARMDVRWRLRHGVLDVEARVPG
jgi:ABC-type lipoprotein export system ATPase subunit